MSEFDQILASQALQKLKSGQELTKSEKKALQAAKDAKQTELLREVKPKFFNDLFGIQNLQRYQWEDVLSIPCGRGRETIDLFAVCAAIRIIFSRRMELAAGTPDMSERKLQKLEEEIKKLQNQNVKQKTENELLARERLPKQLIVSRLDKMSGIIRGVGEDLARKSKLSGDEAQRMLNHALEQFRRELSAIENL
jgi:hypothetical protein